MISSSQNNPVPPILNFYTMLCTALVPILHISKPLLALYGGFRDTVPERLGVFSPALDSLEQKRAGRPLVWIHAVSVGEASVAGALMAEIKKRKPDALIALSTSTFTGRDYITRNLEPDALFFFPLDLPGVMHRLVAKLRPNCFLDIEVELWPNLFKALCDFNVPIALANGRISDRAASPPRAVKGLYRWLLSSFDALFMRSREDVERAVALGAPRERTHLAGNLKFAACGEPPDMGSRHETRKLLGVGNNGKLLVAGSTHPGEDEQLIESWLELKKKPGGLGEIHLVLAPRHLEQVDRIANLVRETGEKVELWTDISDRGHINPGVHAVVVNTIGELMRLYAAADLAFVGGSLIRRGGHNVLEPVAMGVPTLHGPSMDNFHDLKKVLGEADLIIEVENNEEFTLTAERVLKDVDLTEYRVRAKRLIDTQLQAADIIADWVASKLPSDKSVPLVSYRKSRTSKSLAEAILRPVYSAYAKVSHKRVGSYIKNAVKLDVPVISVGNIAIGGTAKTPTVKHIAANRVRHGFKPGIVLRGYKGSLERESSPPALVSDGDKIFLDWTEAGDEARLLAEILQEEHVPVAVGLDRIEASRMLITNLGVDLIILDDGFQFTGLKREFDLALIDALAPFGRADGGQGLLREPASALERADAILLTRSEAVPEIRIEEIKQNLFHSVRNLPPIFIARTVVRGVIDWKGDDLEPLELLKGLRVVGFAGIGNPSSFEKTIESLGCDLADLVSFADHHPYNSRDISRIDNHAGDAGAEILVTTMKDAVRLEGMGSKFKTPLYFVDIGLEIEHEQGFIDFMSGKVERG